MKAHLILIFSLLAIFLFFGCKREAKKVENSSDSVNVWPEEIEEVMPEYFSSDLKWQDLFGDVEYAVTESSDYDLADALLIDSLRFNEAGMVTLLDYSILSEGEKITDLSAKIYYDGNGNFLRAQDAVSPEVKITLSRSEEGDLETITYSYPEGMEGTETFFRNSLGLVERNENRGHEYKGIKTFKYDENGRLIKIIEKRYYIGEESIIEEEIEYLEFDDKGNWIERKLSGERSIKVEGEAPVKDHVERVQKRRIKYRN